jgi:hypothetical protein
LIKASCIKSSAINRSFTYRYVIKKSPYSINHTAAFALLHHLFCVGYL